MIRNNHIQIKRQVDPGLHRVFGLRFGAGLTIFSKSPYIQLQHSLWGAPHPSHTMNTSGDFPTSRLRILVVGASIYACKAIAFST